MREFRGLDIKGVWHYGYLGVTINGNFYIDSIPEKIGNTGSIITNHNIVIPESVGQFTGLKKDKKDGKLGKAKHGQMIFEGDVFRQEIETDLGDRTEYSVVTWINCRAAFYLVNTYVYLDVMNNQDNINFQDDKSYSWLFEDADLYDFSIDVGLPLVGNLHENPELLTR